MENQNKMTRLEEKVGDKTLSIETGLMARQADGAVVCRLGDTVVLSAAVWNKTPKGGAADFVPLTVNYKERTYAAGKIPGGFFKREGRATLKETLSSRLTDRCLRPLFPSGFNNETQVQAMLLSADQVNDGDIMSVIASSAALCISGAPFEGPISAIRLGRIEGTIIINPTFEQRKTSDLDLVIAGTLEGILMAEGAGKEIPDEVLLSCMEIAKVEIDKLCKMQLAFKEKAGKPVIPVTPAVIADGLVQAIEEKVRPDIHSFLRTFPNKKALETKVAELKSQTTSALTEKFPACDAMVNSTVEDVLYMESRRLVLDEGVRADGRKPDQIRQLSSTAGVLPRTHGSALFTRGQTQAIVAVTLGTSDDMQIMDELEGTRKERFMLHYNFPGFATGECKPDRSPGRREIGHGELARRSLLQLLPTPEEFAYTVRIVSDILESNGSSSMATVCGSSLALFDAGVPMKGACAGIAMGLIMEDGKYAILSDIMGMEDHLGDMDFKLAGTRNGITGFQMDVKVRGGIPLNILKEAIAQASRGRNFLLDHMEQTLKAPKPELSQYAPRLIRVMIPQDKIGALIGPGGKNIRRIQEETGAEINVEDDGSVFVSGLEADKVEAAKKMVEYYTAEVELGKVYKGKVISIMDFGAFVEVLPGKEGLLHISEIATTRIRSVEDVLKEGDDVEVKVVEIDNGGKFRLSHKVLLQGAGVGTPPKEHTERRR